MLLTAVAFTFVCVNSAWRSFGQDVITGDDVDDDDDGDDVSKEGDDDRHVRDSPIWSTSTPAAKVGERSSGLPVCAICVFIVMVGTAIETTAAASALLPTGKKLFDVRCWVCSCTCGYG